MRTRENRDREGKTRRFRSATVLLRAAVLLLLPAASLHAGDDYLASLLPEPAAVRPDEYGAAPGERGGRIPGAGRGALVELDGTGSADPDGDRLRYRWRQVDGPPVTLNDPESARPSFRTTVPGRFVFELVVSDGRHSSDPARVVATVDRINLPPEAVVPEEVDAEVGRTVTLDGSPSRDADGDALTFAWRQIGGPPLHLRKDLLAAPVVAFRPVEEGIYEFELVVHDGREPSRPRRTRVVVRPENRIPVARAAIAHEPLLDPLPGAYDRVLPESVLIARIAAPEEGEVGRPVELDGSGSRGPEGRELVYYWKQRSGPFVHVFDRPEPGRLVFEPDTAGVYVFELVVSDGRNESPPVRRRIAVRAGNAPPVAMIEPPEAAEIGKLVRLDGTGSFDPEGGSLRFHWQQTEGPRVLRYLMNDPRGSAVPGFVPKEPGTYGFSLVVSDGTHRSEPAQCRVNVAAVNRPPEARVAGDLTVAPGETAVLQGRASDPDGDPLECAWRQVGGPSILETPARQETLSVTPETPGTYLFAFTVFDGEAASPEVRTRVVCRRPGEAASTYPELIDLGDAGAPFSASPLRASERREAASVETEKVRRRGFPPFPEPELEPSPPPRRLLGRR